MKKIPYLTIAALAALLLFFVLFRLGLTAAGRKRHCEAGGCKTIGSREVQEDFYRIVKREEGLLAVLADGMGRELGGKIAARKVTEVFEELFQEYSAPDHPLLGRESYQRQEASLTVILTDYRSFRYGYLGNSRLRMYRGGQVFLQTRDMSLAREMAD